MVQQRSDFWVKEIVWNGNLTRNSKMLIIGNTNQDQNVLFEDKGIKIFELDKDGLNKKKNVPPAQDQYSSLKEIPFKNEFFNCILFNNIWHQLSDQKTLVSESYRTLRKEGRILILTITRGQLGSSRIFKFFPNILELTAKLLPDSQDIVQSLTQVGFKSTKVYDYYWPILLNPNEYIERVEHFFKNLSFLPEKERDEGINHIKDYAAKHFNEPLKNADVSTLISAVK